MAISIEGYKLPRYGEIPDVGLYLDQTVKYINRSLTPLGLAPITASMVSNYVKKGYITNPVRKQYDREQVAYLLFLAIAKNNLSMEYIHRLFTLQKQAYSAQVAYDYFCTEMENMLFFTFGLKDEPEYVGVTQTELKQMLKSVIIAIAHIIYLNSRLEALPELDKA